MTEQTQQYFSTLLGLAGEQQEQFASYIAALEEYSGKKSAADELMHKNEAQVQKVLARMGIGHHASVRDVQTGLQRETELLNLQLQNFFGFPDFASDSGWKNVIGIFWNALSSEDKRGYFLRYDTAKRLLHRMPPRPILDHFGYRTMDELLEKEDVREVYAALRFAVTPEWTTQFLQQYAELTPADFEERPLTFLLLPTEKWYALAQRFISQKLHPFSHLKELGILFAIPNPHTNHSRDLLQVVSTLLLHYIFEVRFYARFFQSLAERESARFGSYFHDMIVGASRDTIPQQSIRITHQYYTRTVDPHPHAFLPHVNPEPLHWHKGRALLHRVLAGTMHRPLPHDMWDDCSSVGMIQDGTVLSFNSADNMLSGGVHHMYHLFEDVWNALYCAHASEDRLETQLLNHLERGYIPFDSLYR